MTRPKMKQIVIIPRNVNEPKTSWWTGRSEDFYAEAKTQAQRMTQQTIPEAVQKFVDAQHQERTR